MTEKEAETDWHQDFTGTSAFYFFLKQSKDFCLVEPTEKAQQHFDEWREYMEKVCKNETPVTSFQPILKSVVFFEVANS